VTDFCVTNCGLRKI